MTRVSLRPRGAASGYAYCACRDCFELTLCAGTMCHDCDDAGCPGDRECQASGAYGGEEEAPESEPPAAPVPTHYHALVEHQGFALVSEGTFHPATLLARLLDALWLLDPGAHQVLAAAVAAIPDDARQDERHGYWDGPAANRLMVDLMSALDAAAPPSTRFAAEDSFDRLGFFRS